MRKLLAVVLYVCIGLPCLLGGLFLMPARQWILDRSFYKNIVSGPEIRAVLSTPALYEGYAGVLTLGTEAALDGEATGKALKAALPVDKLLSATGGIVDCAFDALDSASRGRAIDLDLRPLRGVIAHGVPEFARVYSNKVPAALEGAVRRAPPNIALDLSVRPSGVTDADFQGLVEKALDNALAAIPDTAQINAPKGKLSDGGEAYTARKTLDRTAWGLLILGGGVWLAAGFIASDSAYKRLKWLGGTLLIPGILVLACGALLRFAADPLVLSTIRDSDFQKFLSDPKLAVLRAWIRKPLWIVSSGFLISGSIAVVLGGGLSASRKALIYRDFE